jgi:phosphate transport system permease protein
MDFEKLRGWVNSMDADRLRLRQQARDGQKSAALEYRRLASSESSLRLRLDASGSEVSLSEIAILHPPAVGLAKRLAVFLDNLGGRLRTASGFAAALIGTALTTLLAAMFASPLGIAAAIWLSEFSRPGLFARLFRRSVQLLSGIPPVVFGAFGLVFLVRSVGPRLGAGFAAPSLLWASLTLGMLALPTVTRQAHLSLQRVPSHLREASLSCGASRLQTLLRVVLPASARGLFSAVLMGAVQALAETAPILLTGAVQLSGRAILDGTFPFFHPLGGFEHLGSHIFYGLEQLPPGPSGAGMESLACLILAASSMGLRALAAELRHPRSPQ